MHVTETPVVWRGPTRLGVGAGVRPQQPPQGRLQRVAALVAGEGPGDVHLDLPPQLEGHPAGGQANPTRGGTSVGPQK